MDNLEEKVIEINHLKKEYIDFSLEIENFTLYKNEIVGLVGENGAGKTTLLSIILDQIRSDSGQINYFNETQISIKIKDDIGFVLGDKFQFNPSFTGNEVEKILSNIYSKWDSTLFNFLAQKFDVPLEKKIRDLSKGMEVKLNLALSLAHHPKLLILDEVTSGLDPIIRDSVLKTIKQYTKDNDVSVIFSTHITTDLEKIADRICILHGGQLILNESINSILSNYQITYSTDQNNYLLENKINKNIYMIATVEIDKQNRKERKWIPSIEEIMLFISNGKKI